VAIAGALALAACGRLDFAATRTSGAPGGADAPGPDACDATMAVAAGRIGWWRLDEGSGTTVADAAGGWTGTLLGGTSWATGRVGDAAVAFDGVDGRIDISGTVAYATQNAAFSFAAWFYLTDYSTTTPDIMQIRSDSASPFHVLMSSMPQYLGLSVGSGDGSWATIKTDAQPSTGQWHHVAMTYTGAGPLDMSNFQLFLDGVAQPLSQSAGYATQAQQSRIGAAEDPRNQWKGLLQNVGIYSRQLSGVEVNQLAALACD